MDMAMNRSINQEKLNASLRMLDKIGEACLEQAKEVAPEWAMRQGRIREILSDVEFCDQFVATESKEAAMKLFADKGFDITDEELIAVASQIKDIACKLVENDGELSEEDLEQVSGGISNVLQGMMIGGAAIGAVIGLATGGPLGALAGAAIGAGVGAALYGIGYFFVWLFD